jgi:hypothetical protein
MSPSLVCLIYTACDQGMSRRRRSTCSTMYSPLPAIDALDKPITPLKYEEKLRGAVVLIGATLSCEQCPEGLQFYADVESIYVVRSPKNRINVSPAKSLCKRRRFQVPSSGGGEESEKSAT